MIGPILHSPCLPPIPFRPSPGVHNPSETDNDGDIMPRVIDKAETRIERVVRETKHDA